MTDRQKALEWVLTELAKYDGRFFESKPPYLVILETIRAALEAPDLVAALLTLDTEVTQLRSLCKAGGYEGVTIGQKKHAAAIAWAKEQGK